MKIAIVCILFLFVACNNKDEDDFKKINFNQSINYYSEFAKMIVPNKDYQNWQYVEFYQQYGGGEKYTIIKEKDSTFKIPELSMHPNFNGLFEGGHPSYKCYYISFIENGKIHYLRNEEQLRDFIGAIDNLEEAILLARTYGYNLDDDIKGSAYRKNGDLYELHLMKLHEFPPQKESVEVKINKHGFIKTKHLGVYVKGRKTYE